MTITIISDDIRFRLSESIAVLEANRSVLTDKMQARLAERERPGEAFGQAEVNGIMLMNMLIECGSDLVSYGDLPDLTPLVREHDRLGISGRHYSQFGLALEPVLREVMGSRLPPKILVAWCDAYWVIVRHLGDGDATPRANSHTARSG